MELVDHVAGAAQAFLDLLDRDQAGAAVLPFDDAGRRAWAYTPMQRPGVSLAGLDRRQTKAAHRLLAALLPLPAYARAVTIMGLDEVLDRIEGYRGDRRHSQDYWISLFGWPRQDSWGVRFEGHHVSVHATILQREVRLTPLFLGANPAVVADHGRPVLAPLGPEEQLGFELLHALSAEQRAIAVISDQAPADIVSRNLPRLAGPSPTDGVALDSLTGPAASCAEALLELYLGRFPAGSRPPDPRAAMFAWAGAREPGAGHYYRIAGPRLLIELDNTQNQANHVHTVWRDWTNDFGGDLLKQHYDASHKQ